MARIMQMVKGFPLVFLAERPIGTIIAIVEYRGIPGCCITTRWSPRGAAHRDSSSPGVRRLLFLSRSGHVQLSVGVGENDPRFGESTNFWRGVNVHLWGVRKVTVSSVLGWLCLLGTTPPRDARNRRLHFVRPAARWIGGLALLVLAAVALLAVVTRRGALSLLGVCFCENDSQYEASEYRYIADTADARCKERELVELLLRDPDQIVQGYNDLATARLRGE